MFINDASAFYFPDTMPVKGITNDNHMTLRWDDNQPVTPLVQGFALLDSLMEVMRYLDREDFMAIKDDMELMVDSLRSERNF